jgi:hypothetical protein
MAPKILGFVPPQGSAERTKILRLRVRGISVSAFFVIFLWPNQYKKWFLKCSGWKVQWCILLSHSKKGAFWAKTFFCCLLSVVRYRVLKDKLGYYQENLLVKVLSHLTLSSMYFRSRVPRTWQKRTFSVLAIPTWESIWWVIFRKFQRGTCSVMCWFLCCCFFRWLARVTRLWIQSSPRQRSGHWIPGDYEILFNRPLNEYREYRYANAPVQFLVVPDPVLWIRIRSVRHQFGGC